jgi:GxxExxY protein
MELLHRDVTEVVIAAAIEVHRALGPGLLESAYEECLAYELSTRDVPFTRQVPLPVVYKAVRLDCGYRMDFVVRDAVVVEVTSVETLAPVHEAQLLTYLRLSSKRVGLLINFNVTRLVDGIVRRVA